MQSQTQTKTQTADKKAKDLPYIIEDFLNIDPTEFSFGQPKKNKIQGSSVPIKYKGKALYVKYDARTCPFGISENKEKKEVQYVNGKTTGCSTSIQCDKDYHSDPYYLKGRELDNFFIETCITNSLEWGLGGSKTKPISRDVIEGYDDQGDNGKWKRIVKYAYKKNGAARVYTEYAPRLEFSLLTGSFTESQTPEGLIAQHVSFNTAFFNAQGEQVPKVDSDNMTGVLPNWSKIAVLAQWQNVSLGTFGACIKPRATQIRVFPSEKLSNDYCMLGDDAEEANEDFCMPADAFSLAKVERVVPKQVSAKPAPLVVQPDADAEAEGEDDKEAEEGEEDVEEDVEEEVVAPTPVKVAVKPVPVQEAPPAKTVAATPRRAARVVTASK